DPIHDPHRAEQQVERDHHCHDHHNEADGALPALGPHEPSHSLQHDPLHLPRVRILPPAATRMPLEGNLMPPLPPHDRLVQPPSTLLVPTPSPRPVRRPLCE